MKDIKLDYPASDVKVPIGINGLDEMCDGGVFESSVSLITGPSGTGKTTFCMHFVLEGLKRGEKALFVSFEESEDQLIRDAMSISWDLKKYTEDGQLTFFCKYPEGAFLDEHLNEIKKILGELNPSRIVVDSISSLKSSFSDEDLRKFSKKFLSILKEHSATAFLTAATTGLMSTEMLSEAHLSIFTDNIFLLKYVETGGSLSTVVSVIKTRGSSHDHRLRTYQITKNGVLLGEALADYEGIMAGDTRKIRTSVHAELKVEFVKLLGPMGEVEFYKLAEKTITCKRLDEYVDSLVLESLITKEKAEAFKAKCKQLIDEEAAKAQ